MTKKTVVCTEGSLKSHDLEFNHINFEAFKEEEHMLDRGLENKYRPAVPKVLGILGRTIDCI